MPASVAAFHLALGPDRALFVSGPTLSSSDPLYRIEPDGTVTTAYAGFGRPQGLAFDPNGSLFVVEALAGSSGLYRVPYGGAGGAGGAGEAGLPTVARVGQDARAKVGGVGREGTEDAERPELVLAGPALVGVAFAPDGTLVVSSNETAYRLRIG